MPPTRNWCRRAPALCQGEAHDSSGQLRPSIDLAGNGRFVRNVIEAAEEEREYRLSESHGAEPAGARRSRS